MLQNVNSGVFSILDRYNYLIRETDDRLFVPADFIVMHTDLIRTIGRDNGDAARTDADGVRGATLSRNFKDIFVSHGVQADGLK